MATVVYSNPSYLSANTGVGVSTSTPTLITVNFPSANVVERYAGSFTLDSSGFPVAGVVTSITSSYNGLTTFQITGIQVSAPQLATAILNNDAVTSLSLVFSGPDVVTGSNFSEAIAVMGGADTVIALGGNDSVLGGDGNDDLNGNQGDDIVAGEAGADTVRGGQGNDTIDGGDGDDPHVNGNIGNDIVFGGAGNDTVFGGQGQDTLSGEAGNDVLSGDLGNDILFGDAGADRFVLRAGSSLDWAADFKFSEGDRIQLSPGQAYTVTAISGQVVIDIGNGDQLGLVGVAAGTFSADWIVFG